MRKNYVKPEIVFESFAASTNIAAGCELRTNTQSLNVVGCTYLFGRDQVSVFSDAALGCVQIPADGLHNGACYHTPSEANNLFNS